MNLIPYFEKKFAGFLVRFRRLDFFLRNYFLSVLELPDKCNSAVIFYFPSDHEQVSGGVLSILHLIDETENILENTKVIAAFFEAYPKIKRYTWLENDIEFTNLYYKKWQLRRYKRLVIHVPEVWISRFRCEWDALKLESINNRVTVNILNQNHKYLPSPDVIRKDLDVFAHITMTLAFIRNLEQCRILFPELQVFVLSAWFYKTEYEVISFEEKENTILVSPDSHPMKEEIVAILRSIPELNVFEMTRLPYEDFKQLQKKVKWSISFGEGYDNYFQGAYYNGGVGFSVYNKTFFHSEFRENELPDVVFPTYEAMRDKIVFLIHHLNNKESYEAISSKIRGIAEKYNSPDIIRRNLESYYKQTVPELY